MRELFKIPFANVKVHLTCFIREFNFPIKRYKTHHPTNQHPTNQPNILKYPSKNLVLNNMLRGNIQIYTSVKISAVGIGISNRLLVHLSILKTCVSDISIKELHFPRKLTNKETRKQ